MAAKPPLVTVTLFRFPVRQAPRAFVDMGLARPELGLTRGLDFWRLVGAGHGKGFSLQPDLRRYGLVAAWRDAEAAARFFAESPFFRRWQERAEESWTARLAPTHAHGLWDGRNPFTPVQPPDERRSDGDEGPPGPVAVLTRATLRVRRLPQFWAAVPSTSRALDEAEGLLASIGIGEAPPLMQATFSLWRSETAVREWAYRHAMHREVIRRTRDEGWYAEELFARFAVVGSEGRWNGRDPVADARSERAA